MKIVIPSHNRPENEFYKKYVPENRRQDVFIVVRKGEQEKLYEHHKDNGVNVIAFDGLTGIHDKRDRIARHFKGEKIWMSDDDLKLRKGIVHEDGLVKPSKEEMTPEQFDGFVNFAENLLDSLPFGSVQHAVFPVKDNGHGFVYNKFVWSNAFLNLEVLDPDMLEYGWLDHSEDVVAFLNTLMAGFDAFAMMEYMIIPPKAGLKGGMTDSRTVEMIERVSAEINKRHPKITTLIQATYAFPGHDRAPITLKMNLRGLKEARGRATPKFESEVLKTVGTLDLF